MIQPLVLTMLATYLYRLHAYYIQYLIPENPQVKYKYVRLREAETRP